MTTPAPFPVRRAGVAIGGAAAVVAAQVGVALLSVGLFSHVPAGAVDASLTWLPLGVLSLGLVAVAFSLRRRRAPMVGWVGPLLVAIAPFTAFGGGCATVTAESVGLGVRLSGVRLAVGAGACATYLNGVVLVVGAALLAGGLWAVDGD